MKDLTAKGMEDVTDVDHSEIEVSKTAVAAVEEDTMHLYKIPISKEDRIETMLSDEAPFVDQVWIKYIKNDVEPSLLLYQTLQEPAMNRSYFWGFVRMAGESLTLCNERFFAIRAELEKRMHQTLWEEAARAYMHAVSEVISKPVDEQTITYLRTRMERFAKEMEAHGHGRGIRIVCDRSNNPLTSERDNDAVVHVFYMLNRRRSDVFGFALALQRDNVYTPPDVKCPHDIVEVQPDPPLPQDPVPADAD